MFHGDAPVFQLKAAIRTRRIENALFIELAVQADKFEMVDKKLQMTRLVPNSAWMRTSRDNTFATGGRPRVTEQQVYMDVSVEPTNVRILRDLMDGSKVSIGVNYNAEQFDKVFRFKAGLLKEDQVALSKCLDRVFGAIKRKK